MSARRSVYSFTYLEPDDVLCVIDMNAPGSASVTNDAENVVEDLRHAGYDLSTARIVYRDSDGTWDEILVSNGRFAGFGSLGAESESEAVAMLEPQAD